jgi:GTPase
MEKHKNLPTVCVVGRPNVGKSSLFNCLMGERRAVVVEQSGTTRDRLEAVIRIGGRSIKLVDTGGYAVDDRDDISMQVKEQIYGAMEEADIILMVTDCSDGVTAADIEVASLLRKFSKEIKVIVNKTDNDNMENEAYEFYQLGFGDPEPVSCVHRRGIRKLKNNLLEKVKEISAGTEEGAVDSIKIAIIGRPNVGKSSFINNMLSRNRVIVSDIPGTTRDSIDTNFSYEGDDYVLIDTAGIRHKRKIKTVVDSFSMMRSRESIKRSDVVILLLDAQDGVTRDDMGILSYVEESGKACLIALNKWDLAEKVGGISVEDYRKNLVYASSRLARYPLSFISSLTGKNVINCLSMVKVLDANLDIKISTPFLNKIFEKADPSNVAVPRRLKRPNFLYIVQHSTRPVEFKYFVSDPSNVLPSHLSFIENQLRANIPLAGIPVKIIVSRSRKDSTRKK